MASDAATRECRATHRRPRAHSRRIRAHRRCAWPSRRCGCAALRRDLVQNDRFRDLDAVQHLPQKLEARLRKTGKEYTQKLLQLLSRIQRNFATITHAASFRILVVHVVLYDIRSGSAALFVFSKETAFSDTKPSRRPKTRQSKNQYPPVEEPIPASRRTNTRQSKNQYPPVEEPIPASRRINTRQSTEARTGGY